MTLVFRAARRHRQSASSHQIDSQSRRGLSPHLFTLDILISIRRLRLAPIDIHPYTRIRCTVHVWLAFVLQPDYKIVSFSWFFHTMSTSREWSRLQPLGVAKASVSYCSSSKKLFHFLSKCFVQLEFVNIHAVDRQSSVIHAIGQVS